MKSANNQPNKNKLNQNNFDIINGGSDELLYTETLIDRKIVDEEGYKTGTIKNFLFSKKLGRIEFVVVRLYSSNDSNRRYITVPYEALEYRGAYEPIMVHANQEMIDKAPGFKKVELHEIFTRHYDLVSSYWGSYFGSPRDPVVFN